MTIYIYKFAQTYINTHTYTHTHIDKPPHIYISSKIEKP